MSTASSPQELESLVTRISMDVGDFHTKADGVMAKIDAIVAKGQKAGADMAAFGSNTLGQLQSTVTGLQQVAGEMAKISFGTLSSNAGDLNRNLNNLRSTVGNFGNALAPGTALFKNFDIAVQGLVNTLGKLAGGASGLTTIRTELDALISWMKGTGSLLGRHASDLAKSLSKLGSFLDSVTNVNYKNLQQLPTELGNFFAKLPPPAEVANMAKLSSAMRSLMRAVNDMAKMSGGGLLAASQNLSKAMGVLNSLSASPNLTKLASTLQQLGSGMRGLNRGIGGGGGPGRGGGGIFGGLLGGLGAIPPAARSASMGLGNFGYDMMRLEGQANSFGASLLTLRYGLAGIGILGIYQFSQLDEALARASAHAKDFGRTLNDELRAGVFGTSGVSTSSATELAKAADKLMTAGLSSTSAIRGLPLVENFAVASGIKAGEAAKGLTDLMHAMDLTGNTSVEFLTHMRNVSDMLVGISRASGSTEQEMLNAFTTRFLTASRLAKLSMEESVTVLGLLSRAGEGYRGAKGGNIAARGIEQLALESVGGRQQWLNMLGDTVYDTSGQFKPFLELLTLLNEKMAERGTDKFIAEMKTMKLGSTETINAIEPLLRVVGGIKDMREELGKVGGVTKATADTIRTSLQSQMMMLWNNLANVANVIGERLAPALYLITKPLTDMLQAFTELNPAIQYTVVLAGAALVAWKPVVWVFSSLTGLVVRLAVAPFKLLYNTITGTWGLLKTLAGWISTAFSALGTVLYYGVGVPLNWLGERLTDLMVALTRVVNVLERLWLMAIDKFNLATDVFARLVLMSTTILVSVGAGLLTWFFILPPLISLAITAISGLAAVVVTAGIGIAQLVSLVGVGFVQAWAAFKVAAVSAIGWLAKNMDAILENTRGLLGVLQAGFGAFIKDAANGLMVISGLLWNFRENLRITIDWVAKYGAVPFENLAEAAFASLETLASNVWLFSQAVVNSVGSIASAVWSTLTNVFGAVGVWLSNYWQAIGRDIGNVIVTIVNNVAKNWKKLEELFTDLKNSYATEWFASGFPGGQAEVMKQQMKREAMIKKFVMTDMAGPLTDMPKLETDFSVLGEGIAAGFSGPASAKAWQRAGREIAFAFGRAAEDAYPIFKAFSDLGDMPIWQELIAALNFGLPSVKEAGDFLKKMISPAVGGGGTGAAVGRDGPGFTFKQSSLARFMYEGSINEKLDYQQLVVLRSLDAKIEIGNKQRAQMMNTPKVREQHTVNQVTGLRTMPTPVLGD